MTESKPPQTRPEKETFLERVRSSGLISPEELQKALEGLPETDRGKVVARALVERGLLTKFQAERLLAGKTGGFLIGQYRILDELGKGGMGRIFKAEHMSMGRIVAIKILSSALLKTERARQLFQREVKAAARLHHPNIVTAFDANQVGDRCFLVMEFVDGPNLHDLVKDHGPLPVTQACDYIRQAAVGLQCAHDLGMVHRDIKPANLLVQKSPNKSGGSESNVKILDFGLARVNSSEDGSAESDSIETAKNMVMGTPDYLSPEQARSLHAVDGRSDIYSLGCTLHFLLTGKAPYPGGTTMEKLVRHSTEAATPVNQIRPDIPIEVAIVVQRMMAKKPEDRYQTANDVAGALQPFTGHEAANWVVVEPLPAEYVVPVTEPQLPRLAPSDPWQNLAEESDYEAGMVGTLVGEGEATELSTTETSKYRRPKKQGSLTWLWVVVGFLALIGAAIGLYLVMKAKHVV
jgi:serine/threonine-protein kinase